MLVGEDELPPEPGELKGRAVFGGTAEEAEPEAKADLALQCPESETGTPLDESRAHNFFSRV